MSISAVVHVISKLFSSRGHHLPHQGFWIRVRDADMEEARPSELERFVSRPRGRVDELKDLDGHIIAAGEDGELEFLQGFRVRDEDIPEGIWMIGAIEVLDRAHHLEVENIDPPWHESFNVYARDGNVVDRASCGALQSS